MRLGKAYLGYGNSYAYKGAFKPAEAAGAVVLAAQTRFYLAQMLARQPNPEGARTLLTTLCRQFHAWGVPVW